MVHLFRRLLINEGQTISTLYYFFEQFFHRHFSTANFSLPGDLSQTICMYCSEDMSLPGMQRWSFDGSYFLDSYNFPLLWVLTCSGLGISSRPQMSSSSLRCFCVPLALGFPSVTPSVVNGISEELVR